MAGNPSPLAHRQPIYAVGAVAYRYDACGRLQILLIKKRNGYWTLPKGGMHAVEDEASALLRELREETGLAGIVEDKVARVNTSPRDGGFRGARSSPTIWCVWRLTQSPSPALIPAK